jgi:hypothetical protein
VKGKRADRPDTAETKPAEGETIAAPGETKPAAAPAADSTIKTYEKIIVTESIKHAFTTHELAEIADRMGAAASHVFQIESEKAEQAAHYTALLKGANRTHAELVAKYNLRYEMRDVECRIEYDKPEPGYKSFVRTDNGESVKELRMTEAERQRAFVFDAGDGKPQ